MTGRVGLAGLMLAFLAGVAPATAAPLERCRDDKSARYGTIKVPLHRAEPQGPKLTVSFRVFPRTDRSRPALEPVVAAEGGPGYGSIDAAGGYRFMLGPLLARRDLIVVDNRGTGRSGAIGCQGCRPFGGIMCARLDAARASSGKPQTRMEPARRPTISRRCSIA